MFKGLIPLKGLWPSFLSVWVCALFAASSNMSLLLVKNWSLMEWVELYEYIEGGPSEAFASVIYILYTITLKLKFRLGIIIDIFLKSAATYAADF